MIIKIPFSNKKFLVEWWEIKAIIKLKFRKIFYSSLINNFISYFIYFYLFLVFKTSKKNFIGFENLDKLIVNKDGIVFAMWHNRLMMIPFIARRIKKKYNKHNLMTLASRHGDGKIVGKVMERFGMISILGSTKDKKNSSRGIEFSSLRKIIDGLKNGYALGMTPDGPRGPNQKINGELLNIVKLTNSKLIVISYSCSNFITVNKSWDKFKIPLPFSKLVFYVDDKCFEIPHDIDDNAKRILHDEIENRINYLQNICDKNVLKT